MTPSIRRKVGLLILWGLKVKDREGKELREGEGRERRVEGLFELNLCREIRPNWRIRRGWKKEFCTLAILESDQSY